MDQTRLEHLATEIRFAVSAEFLQTTLEDLLAAVPSLKVPETHPQSIPTIHPSVRVKPSVPSFAFKTQQNDQASQNSNTQKEQFQTLETEPNGSSIVAGKATADFLNRVCKVDFPARYICKEGVSKHSVFPFLQSPDDAHDFIPRAIDVLKVFKQRQFVFDRILFRLIWEKCKWLVEGWVNE